MSAVDQYSGLCMEQLHTGRPVYRFQPFLHSFFGYAPSLFPQQFYRPQYKSSIMQLMRA